MQLVMASRRVLLHLLDERPRVRGSKRSFEDIKRLAEFAYTCWKGMELLGWVKWEKNVLIVERI
jgi:hypothetical protein